ncbi:MAG: PKD domain-containing protein, partial [Thermoplasmata archaeon]|nr:PKD domain-containing protein [Thermoplasmata archaeon]
MRHLIFLPALLLLLPLLPISPEVEAGREVFYSENFENGDGGYTHFGYRDSWEWGSPETSPPDFPPDGLNLWGTNLSGTYPKGSRQHLLSPSISISSYRNLTLQVMLWLSITPVGEGGSPLETPGDIFTISISIDGGDWVEVKRIDSGWNGEGIWGVLEVSLPPTTGAEMRLNFTLWDYTTNYQSLGAYIDWVKVVGERKPEARPQILYIRTEPLLSPSEESAVQVGISAGVGETLTYTLILTIKDHLGSTVSTTYRNGSVEGKVDTVIHFRAPNKGGLYTISTVLRLAGKEARRSLPLSVGDKVLLDGFSSPPEEPFLLQGEWRWSTPPDYVHLQGALVCHGRGGMGQENLTISSISIPRGGRVLMGVITSYSLPPGSLGEVLLNGEVISPEGGYPETTINPLTGGRVEGFFGTTPLKSFIFDISSSSGTDASLSFVLSHNTTCSEYNWTLDSIYIFTYGKSGGLEDYVVVSLNYTWLSPSSLRLSWEETDVEDFSSYLVYLSSKIFTSVEDMTPYLRIQRKDRCQVTLEGLKPDTTYYVAVVVEDSSGQHPSKVVPLMIEPYQRASNTPPIAVISTVEKRVKVGQRVYFDASSSYDPDGDTLTFAWNFGDGHTAEGERVNHVYKHVGNYTVTLVVSDGRGGIAEDKVEIVVYSGEDIVNTSFLRTLLNYLPTLSIFLVALVLLLLYLL